MANVLAGVVWCGVHVAITLYFGDVDMNHGTCVCSLSLCVRPELTSDERALGRAVRVALPGSLPLE